MEPSWLMADALLSTNSPNTLAQVTQEREQERHGWRFGSAAGCSFHLDRVFKRISRI